MTRATAILVLLLAAAPALAQNGKVGWAYTATDIVVDGDLSDWPDNLPVYEIAAVESGDELAGDDDLFATMRVAHEPGAAALYVAVEVRDQSLVIGKQDEPLWNRFDGCEVYVGLDSVAGGSIYIQEALYGADRQLRSQVLNGADPQFDLVDSLLSVVATSETAGGLIYEWRIDLERLSDGHYVHAPNMALAFDVAVCDRDEDGSFSWVAWGPRIGKVSSRERMGTMILLEPDALLEDALAATSELQMASVAEARRDVSYQMFLTGVLVTVTFLHLLLVVFGSQRLANSSYALFTGTAAAIVYIVVTQGVELAQVMTSAAEAVLLGSAVIVVGLFGLLFLYAVFYGRVQPAFWVLLGWMILAGSYLTYLFRDPSNEGIVLGITGGMFGGIVVIWMTVDATRILISAIYHRRDGALTIGAGGLAFITLSLYGQFADRLSLGLMLGILLPVLAVSVHLARSVARTRRDLEHQLVEVRHTQEQLQASNRALATANAEVQQATSNKSEFLRRMSHDLRSPMNAIIGYTRLILRRAADQLEPRQVRNLENIRTSADNLLELINDILDLSRIEAGRLELHPRRTDLRLLVEQCADTLAPLVRPGVELRRELQDVDAITIDPDRLRQVIMNLLGNAVKFTSAGSSTLALDRRDDATEITVTDTGVGIPPQDLPHIFDEFHQVERQGGDQAEGTGLGLSIARKTVELLGGQVAVASEVDGGTTFTVRLPDPDSATA